MDDCKSERAAAAVAQIHINRAAQVLSAANDILKLAGSSETTRAIVSRRAFDMALKSLGDASAAIDIQHKEVSHG